MKFNAQFLALSLAGLVGFGPAAHAQAPSATSSRRAVTWTIAGAGGGFGIGLWAGLTKFDDAINSERKVWTTAVVGSAIGGVAGYLIGRSRAARRQSVAPVVILPSIPTSQIGWPRNIGVVRNIVVSPHGDS